MMQMYAAVRAALAAMLHPHAHLDAASPRYRRLSLGRAFVYFLAAAMAFGSLFMPLYVSEYDGVCAQQTYSAKTFGGCGEQQWDEGRVERVADSACLTFRLRMQAAATMAILSIITSLLTALSAVSDAWLAGRCSCLVRAIGPRGFGCVSAVLSATAFATLVIAFGIVVGHYHSINPCDFSNASMAEDARNSLGPGVFITLCAFTAIGAVEALRFILIRAAWLPPSTAADSPLARGSGPSLGGGALFLFVAKVRRWAPAAVLLFAVLALHLPLCATTAETDFSDESDHDFRTYTHLVVSFWGITKEVRTFEMQNVQWVLRVHESSVAGGFECISGHAKAGAAFVIAGAVAAVVALLAGFPSKGGLFVPTVFVYRAAAFADVCCFACIWLGFIIAADMFFGVRCDDRLALANRGFNIAPDPSSSGYVFLFLAAAASAVCVLPCFVALSCRTTSSYQIVNTPDTGGCSACRV